LLTVQAEPPCWTLAREFQADSFGFRTRIGILHAKEDQPTASPAREFHCTLLMGYSQIIHSMVEIFTAGYEGLDPERFFGLLQRCGIQLLLDVRQLPLSRKPGFSKGPLAGFCDEHGIEYQHFPDLGCPRHIRNEYRETGDWLDYTVRFKQYLEKQDEALAEVARVSLLRKTCLLCFEVDFNFCHRTYVAEALAPLVGGTLQISHLTGPIRGRIAIIPQRAAA
jgi:hypothetical protein